MLFDRTGGAVAGRGTRRRRRPAGCLGQGAVGRPVGSLDPGIRFLADSSRKRSALAPYTGPTAPTNFHAPAAKTQGSARFPEVRNGVKNEQTIYLRRYPLRGVFASPRVLPGDNRRRVRVNPAVPFPMAYFLGDDGRDVGHLFMLPGFRVSADGPIVYMEIDNDLSDTLRIIERNGGKVVLPKTLIAPGKGYWALFLDTEGNRLALHSDM